MVGTNIQGGHLRYTPAPRVIIGSKHANRYERDEGRGTGTLRDRNEGPTFLIVYDFPASDLFVPRAGCVKGCRLFISKFIYDDLIETIYLILMNIDDYIQIWVW